MGNCLLFAVQILSKTGNWVLVGEAKKNLSEAQQLMAETKADQKRIIQISCKNPKLKRKCC